MQGTWLKHFSDFTLCSYESASKLHPLMLEQIIQEMKVDKERVVIISDSIHDIEIANSAGVTAISVSCGANNQAELQQYNPLLSLANTTELLTFITSLVKTVPKSST